MQRKPRISSYEATMRAKKGWRTKKSRYPSRYGEVRNRRVGSPVWNRHNEQIPLKNFSDKDIERLKPALVMTDKMLKPTVRTNLDEIRKGRTGGVHARYTVPATIGNTQLGKSRITISPTTFKKPRIAPSGVLAHEIGHSVFPGPTKDMRTKTTYTDYQRAFNYKQKSSSDITKIDKYTPTQENPLSRSRKPTRQKANAAEDFAETFRHLSGLPVSNRRYWREVYVDKARMEYMFKHHINPA